MAGLNGKWKVQSVEGSLDDVARSAGMDDESRAKVVGLLQLTGDAAAVEEYEFTATTGKRILHVGDQKKGDKVFKLNEQVETSGIDGRTMKIKVVVESDTKVVRYDSFDNGAEVVITTEVVGDKMVTTHCCGGHTAVRTMVRA